MANGPAKGGRLIRQQTSPSGLRVQTNEVVLVEFPAGAAGSIQTVVFPVQSRMKPGAAVLIFVQQAVPNFLILNAEVGPLGTVTASAYYVVVLAAPTVFDLTVLIFATDRGQGGV